jgi:hypothetical protein
MQPREWLLVAILVAVFAPALVALAQVWASVDYQSHGLLRTGGASESWVCPS